MNKLEILLENHKDDVLSFIDKLYSEKYPKKKSSKTICHFKTLGNIYNDDIFVKNYVDFMNHVSMILKDTYQIMLLMIRIISQKLVIIKIKQLS